MRRGLHASCLPPSQNVAQQDCGNIWSYKPSQVISLCKSLSLSTTLVLYFACPRRATQVSTSQLPSIASLPFSQARQLRSNAWTVSSVLLRAFQAGDLTGLFTSQQCSVDSVDRRLVEGPSPPDESEQCSLRVNRLPWRAEAKSRPSYTRLLIIPFQTVTTIMNSLAWLSRPTQRCETPELRNAHAETGTDVFCE